MVLICPAQIGKVLSHGVHPSDDFEGVPLPSLHAKWNGKPIAGWVLETTHPFLKTHRLMFRRGAKTAPTVP